jgi:N-acetylglucosaminyldiphosphoundecaprenol N-acetyl-beta-D-mannosaminyltransferase
VVLASLILGRRIPERSTGPDLFLAVMQGLDRAGGRSVFYLGGTAATLPRIESRHRDAYPNVRLAGLHAPPVRPAFSSAEVDDIVARINAARPDVLWVGVGAPKQEKLLLDLRDRISVPLCGPIGAMFDYFAGAVPPPPKWMDRLGLHWLYRLARSPRRMWRRNLDSPVFLARVLRDRLRGGRGG